MLTILPIAPHFPNKLHGQQFHFSVKLLNHTDHSTMHRINKYEEVLEIYCTFSEGRLGIQC